MNEKKIVPFKTNAGISDRLLEHLLEKGKPYGLESILPFHTDEIIIAEWVYLKCRYGCRLYNKNWCCPPATPSPERVRKILEEYSLALLLVGNRTFPEIYHDNDNAKKRAKQVRCWKGTVSLERFLFLEGYYKAFGLVGEACALCKECNYPGDCLFPQEKRPSVESFSIDVIGMLKNLGVSTQVAGHKTESFRYYGIILLE